MRKLFQLPARLRMTELQDAAETTIDRLSPFDFLETHRQIVIEKTALFLKGMEKTRSKRDRGKADKIRDDIIRGMTYQVKASNALMTYEDDANVAENHKKLMDIFDAHGKGLITLAYSDETKRVKNYLTQLKTLDPTFLELAHLTTWINLLETTNDDFAAASEESIQTITSETGVSSASEVAEELITALNEMYTILYAQVLLNATPELENAYDYLETLINQI